MAPWNLALRSSILMVQFHFTFGFCLALSPILLLALLRACVCSFCGCLLVSLSISFLFVALSLSFDLSNFVPVCSFVLWFVAFDQCLFFLLLLLSFSHS